MSEFSDRLKDSWSRLDVRDRKTQFTLAGSLAGVVLVIALVAWSVGGSSGGAPAVGTTSQRASELAQKAAQGKGPLAAAGSGSASAPSGSRSTAAVDVSKSAPASLPPLTDTTIKLGITYVKDANSANEAAGFGQIGRIDQRRGYEAMIREINKNPPFGRKLVPVWYSQTNDEIASKGGERISQEACAHFTQDNKVFMMWDGALIGGSDTTFHVCATKAGIPEMGFSGGLSWSKTYKDFPYLVDPTDAALDRMARFEVDQLYKHGFFSKFKDNQLPYTPQKPADGKPRIGLIRYDQPSYKAGAAAMKERLAAHGLSLCDGCEFEIAYSSDNPQEQLDDATEVNAAIQSCKSKGCTHMLFLGSTAGVRITLFFVDGAEKQQYRPRLGFNPLDAPTAVRDFLGAPSYPQFRQSVLIADGPTEFDVRTDAFKKCKKLFEDAGEDFSGEQGVNKQDEIPLWCDTAWYTKAALQAAGRTLTVDTLMNGVATITPVESASVYLMQTKAERHDGSGAIRVGAWFDDCNCWKPTTGVIPV
jgi:hypothetical protein